MLRQYSFVNFISQYLIFIYYMMETVKGKPIFKHQGYSLDCRKGHRKKTFLCLFVSRSKKTFPTKSKSERSYR